ncbi:MAG: response regulator transcription factor [Acidobacteriaceae bacterium]
MNRPRLLLVDDEPQITRVLRTALTIQGYDIQIAADGVTALRLFEEWQPDMVITDLAMPKMDGVALCREIRVRSQVPLLVLSVRNQEQTKVEALDAGADDFVTKPFSTGELLARVRANLRRAAATPEKAPLDVLEVGQFRIDPEAHQVLVAGELVRLTPKEFDLLHFMAQHPGKTLTHRQLLVAVWGAYSSEQPEYLRVFVGQLRKKIERDGKIKYIVTEPWVGYRLDPDGAP